MGCGCGSDSQPGGCDQASQGCSCGQGSCCETEQMPNQEQMFEMFVGLAEAAWYKALKEKMMQYYVKNHSKELDKMAEFFAHTADMKWMNYEDFKKKKPELMKKFMEESEKAKKK